MFDGALEDSAEARVAKGAAFLDRAQPGWRKRVSTLDLDIRHARHCMLGQVFGDVRTAQERFVKNPDFDPVRLGFWAGAPRDGSGIVIDAADLTRAWIIHLKQPARAGEPVAA
jgi:hypothetical protein